MALPGTGWWQNDSADLCEFVLDSGFTFPFGPEELPEIQSTLCFASTNKTKHVDVARLMAMSQFHRRGVTRIPPVSSDGSAGRWV